MVFMRMLTRTLLIGIGLVLLFCGCQQHGSRVRSLLSRAAGMSEAEQYNDAISLYRKALALDPRCEEAALQLALIYDDCLKDKSNAVVAYEYYLNIARNDAARTQATQWLNEARRHSGADMAHGAAPADTGISPDTQRRIVSELELKQQQFDELRRQMVERYEARITELEREVAASRLGTHVAANAGSALHEREADARQAALLAQVSSGEVAIASLQRLLTQRERQLADAQQTADNLRKATSDLQRRIDQANARAQLSDAYNASNTVLAMENAALLRRLAAAATPADKPGNNEGGTAATVPTVPTHDYSALNAELQQVRQQYQSLRQKYIEEVEYRRRLGEQLVRLQNDTGVRVARAATSTPRLPAQRAVVTGSSAQAAPAPMETLGALVQTPRDAGTRMIASTRSASVPPPTFVESGERPETAIGRTYTVQPGDSLMKISRELYGDAALWSKLFYGNRDILPKPDQLRVGQVLRVP
jgi:nucleoid-associated protein YgaU